MPRGFQLSDEPLFLSASLNAWPFSQYRSSTDYSVMHLTRKLRIIQIGMSKIILTTDHAHFTFDRFRSSIPPLAFYRWETRGGIQADCNTEVLLNRTEPNRAGVVLVQGFSNNGFHIRRRCRSFGHRCYDSSTTTMTPKLPYRTINQIQ